MTRDRAKAYRRVVATLRDLGPAKLLPSEQACIRDAADTLLFCSDLDTDCLTDAGRWTGWRARRLLDDIWACGPGAAMLEAGAA
jgi:hypothetical protein